MVQTRREATSAQGASTAPGALEESLVRDPRFLTDARLLAALHGELRRRLGDAAAEVALLQAGFFHGLCDALRVTGDARVRNRQTEGDPPAATPLIAVRMTNAADERGPALRGSWPLQLEAEAVLLARGRTAAPACLVSAGYTSGWLSGLWGMDCLAIERGCAAAGHGRCEFEAREAAAWCEDGDVAARALLAGIPFAGLRDAAARALPVFEPANEGAFDPDSPAVHVWGPVMVVPYAGEETAVTVEAVAREPGAAAVSVVIVDLDGAVVDDGFGAVALERVVDVIHAWGAEAMITGLSPLSERVVLGLAGAPIVMRKDLRTAIATAFQIAESQRRNQ
jgi:hypothetical protein